jgi:hypothetical protein
MTISVTLSLGYLTIPLIIKHSIKSLETTAAEEEDEITTSSPQWTFGNTICISSFVQSPPNIYPTIEKHVLQLAHHSNSVEKETLSILSNAFNSHTNNSKSCHGLAILNKDLLGIFSSTSQSNTFNLQIVQYNTSSVSTSLLNSDNNNQRQQQQSITPATINIKSYYNASTTNSDTILDIDQLAKPLEIMEICQIWPNSQPQLAKLAKQIYQTASLYGYWDYWRVFEGICHGHQIQAQHLLN